jgi:hypothetical protein
MLYPNNLKTWEFGKKAPQNFYSEQATIAERQGASENENSEVYRNHFKIWFLSASKPRGLIDRKRVHIVNIEPFAIVEPRELSRSLKTKF